MSIPVTADDLAARLEEYGGVCFLATVGTDDAGCSSTKIVHVPVAWDGEVLRCTPGRGTLANLGADIHGGEGGPVTLVFPGPTPGAHSMLLDGTGRADGDVAVISVTGGVLHRPAPTDPPITQPSNIPDAS
ncbi:MAG: pyridoxamine 5'-phosphate oxidase [Actinobacteria bacterium]|nr:pyridoxamine 5'-phosphate oxidase [Actinomycetota bacterium]